MKKSIKSLTLIAGSLIAMNTFAANHQISPKGLFDYKFKPNQQEVINNYLPIEMKMICDITGQDESNTLYFQALDKKVEINGTVLTQGQATKLILHAGDKVSAVFAGSAELGVTNLGKNVVEAHCTTD